MSLVPLLAAGAATGMIGSILGIGGGIFLVPALVLWFDVPIAHAAGAGLVAVIATSSAASASNIKKGTANMPLGLVLETSTVLGAITGGLLAAHSPDRAVIGVFGALLAAITVLLWRDPVEDCAKAAPARGALGGEYYDASERRTVRYGVRRMPAALSAGFLAGNLSGLLGVGGGVLKVPVLHLWCGVPMKAAAATSNFMIGVTAAAGAIVYFGHGRLDATLSATVALGVLAGSTLGAKTAGRLRDPWVRRAFAVLTLFLGLQMLRRALG